MPSNVRPPQCLQCKFADWKKTATNRLHPSGEGKCTWQYPTIHLPTSMYFFGSHTPSGGHINRKETWTQCKQFQPIAAHKSESSQ